MQSGSSCLQLPADRGPVAGANRSYKKKQIYIYIYIYIYMTPRVRLQTIDFWNYPVGLHMDNKTRLLAQQEDMSSCPTRRLGVLLNKKACLVVDQEDRKTCPLGAQEETSSCWTGRHVLLLDKKTGHLVDKKDCLLVEQEVQHEDTSSCPTRRHAFLRTGKEHMRHRGGIQEAPRKHPRGAQEAPRRSPGGQGHHGDRCAFICACAQK